MELQKSDEETTELGTQKRRISLCKVAKGTLARLLPGSVIRLGRQMNVKGRTESGYRTLTIGIVFSVYASACGGMSGQEAEAILSVLDTIATTVPEGVSTCVSTRFLFEADSTLPARLQRRLRREGWSLYDPRPGADSLMYRSFPPDTGASVIIIDSPRRVGETWLISASNTRTRLGETTVRWSIYDYDHRVSCAGDTCAVVEVRSKGHGDGSLRVEDFLRHDRPPCGGPAGPFS